MISIRKASIKDLETIQKLNNKLSKKENEEFDQTVNPVFATTDGGVLYFKKSLEGADNIILIAEEGESPVGYIAAGIYLVGSFRTIPNFCEVENMWVDEQYRSQGIGKQLMQEVEVWAKGMGIARMRVIASYDNKKGINFYKREGFEEYDLILEKDL
jgi:ribosomal protein S18 acetylase RimI-like enzyme